MKILKRIGIFIYTFFLYGLIASVFCRTDKGGTVVFPDWVIDLGIIVSLLAAFSGDIRRIIKKIAPADSSAPDLPAENISIPFSAKKQRQLAESLLSEINVNVDICNTTTYVPSFVQCYDKAMMKTKTLTKLRKVKFYSSPPTREYRKMKKEFQQHLCGAICRAKDQTIIELRTECDGELLKNIHLDFFRNSISDFRPRFSRSTSEFAEKCIAEVEDFVRITHDLPAMDPNVIEAVDTAIENGHAFVSYFQRRLKLGYAEASNLVDRMEKAGIVTPINSPTPCKILITKQQWNSGKYDSIFLHEPEEPAAIVAPSRQEELHKYGGLDAELLTIDMMEGHDFERWCADALELNGFTHVEVTKGSGDQGVDILATKDGVKFAFQCKRYKSPLGNSPVQEVHAGKSFYDCHACGVITNQTFTVGAKDLALKLGVILWDSTWIIEQLQKKYED